MTDWQQKARDAISSALSQLGTGPEITRGIVVAQLHAAQQSFLKDIYIPNEFVKARRAWAAEKEVIVAQMYPKWFVKVEAGLFAAASGKVK